MAKRMQAAYGLEVYHVDDALFRHRPHLDPERQPCLHKWSTSSWDELWMRPVNLLLAETKDCYDEHFDLTVADVLGMPWDRSILVEGTCLLPDRVAGLLDNRRRAIWVVPSEAFQREMYPRRGEWVQQILGQCRNPEQALKNWMDRDVAFARWILNRTGDLSLQSMIVDGKASAEENAALVSHHFGFVV